MITEPRTPACPLFQHFAEWSPDELVAFLAYCECRGWLTFPADYYRFHYEYRALLREARTFVPACAARGLCAYPDPAKVRAEVAAMIEQQNANRPLICLGKHKTHYFKFVPGVGDRCSRCNAEPTRKHKRTTAIAA